MTGLPPKKPDFRRIAGATSRIDAARAGTPSEDDDHHRNAPSPSPDCLYGLVGEIAKAGGDTTEANPYAIALNALAYIGCCLGRGPYMPVGNTYHHARLFTMHVGRSGSGRKGDAVSLIHRIDMSLRKESVFLAPQVHRGGLSSREGLAFLIHDGYREGKKEVEPIHDKRLWVIESEFANVLHQTKRDGNTLSAALRDCWDGVAIKPATKSNRISASHPHVSLSAAVTPAELLSLIEARELSNGFANRFLTIFSERSRLMPFPTATPQGEVNRLATRLGKVLEFAKVGRYADRDHTQLSLAPSAATLYTELYGSELNKRAAGPLIDGLLERRAPVLLRIAMIFALTDGETIVAKKHIEAALAWVRFWADSVTFIFSTGAQEKVQQEVNDAARKIVAFLTEHSRQSRSAISVDCFHGKLSKDRLDDALDELLHCTPPVIEVEVEPRKDGPGSATKFYLLAAKSAKSAKPGTSCGFTNDSGPDEVSEISEIRADPAGGDPTTFRSIRSLRDTSNPLEDRTNAHVSLSSLISPANTDTEVF